MYFRPPEQLKITGNGVAENWRRFHEQWENYITATELSTATSERQAAIFLTCIGGEAYDIFRTLQFDPETNRKKIEPIIAAFETYCTGSVNITYERYIFNRRT